MADARAGIEWQATAVGISETLEVMAALARGIPIATVDSVRKGTLILERTVKQALTAGNPLKVVTGNLRASYASRVFITQDGVRGVMGSPSKYAAIHEYGGVVRPVRARALTIPLTPVARRRKARDFGDLFMWRSKDSGNAFLAQPTVGGGFQLLYLLARQVHIPARYYLSKSRDVAEPQVVALVGNRVALTVQRAHA